MNQAIGAIMRRVRIEYWFWFIVLMLLLLWAVNALVD
jgi:hypothetical protein